MSSKVRCKLNPDGSLCLCDIIDLFHSPIEEEHAWALCYQCCQLFLGLLGTNNRENCLTLSNLNHVFLQTDGNVHSNTFFGGGGNNVVAGSSRRNISDEQELFKGLGIVMYQALDYGVNDEEERVLSHDLEQLIEDLFSEDGTIPHHGTDDEGIGNDSEEAEEEQEGSRLSIHQVMQRCENHLTVLSKPQVKSHYKAVVRALVTEALELSMFLERVSQGTSSLGGEGPSSSDLDQLQFADWARCWMQVVAELRMGVELRKIQYSRLPIEYELTPYEILMKDIRSCRYNLRKIMVNGNVPYKITNDAHAVILEFIRSRPPLKKASDRNLPPQPENLTPRDHLMNSIRKGRALRPVRNNPRFQVEISGDDSAAKARKLVKADFFESEEYPQICDGSLESLGVPKQLWGIQSVPHKSRPDGMLTLKEIVHIRSVITKADLEALPVEGRVRADVESGKVCFACLKTRFGIFSPWGQRCVICKRTVCARCCSKMDMPIEHFPVALLSPSLLATPEDDLGSGSRGSSGRVALGPGIGALGSDRQIKHSTSGEESENSAMIRFKARAMAVGNAAVDKLKGSQLAVCHDCKLMLQ